MISLLIRLSPAVLLLALAACDLRFDHGRGNRAIAEGPWGPYYRENMKAVLPEGDTVTVYRVSYLQSLDGKPALQVEYEPPFPVRDTLRVQAFARRLWPTVMPYVQGALANTSVLTATNLNVGRDSVSWLAFHVFVDRHAGGAWRLRSSPEPLPPGVLGRERIYQPGGAPLRIHELRQLVETLDSTRTQR